MAFTPLYKLATQIPVVRLHCSLALQENAQLPVFKGSMLHGWLGQQLFKQDRSLYSLLYNEYAPQQPKPYALACYDHRVMFSKQSTLNFDLLLLGSVTQIADQIVRALSNDPLGIGPERSRICLQSVASHTSQGLRLGIHPEFLAAWLHPTTPSLVQSCVLQLKSPLRIKKKGKIVQHAVPSLSLLLSQIQRRLALIATFWVNDDPDWTDILTRPIFLGDHRVLKGPFYFEDWKRYSHTHQEHLPFGGVMGELGYEGDIHHAVEWLQVGQSIQIGGKTTFGLGCYQLLY